MASLIFGAIIGVVGIVLLIMRTKTSSTDRYGRSSNVKTIYGVTGALALLLCIALIVSAFFTRVPPREVGVETVWGKYERTLESGVHPAAPWASVETFPTTFQESAPDVGIGFKGGASGVQPVKAQWTITGDEAKALWERFKTFEQTNEQLVDNAIKEETVRVFRDHSPSDVVNGEGTADKMQKDIREAVTKRLAPYGVTVDSLSFHSAVQPDETARNNIKMTEEAITKRDRAAIELKTAEDEAEADKIRNRESSPESIQLECLDTLRTWDVNKNGQAPFTLNCGLGDGAEGVMVNKG